MGSENVPELKRPRQPDTEELSCYVDDEVVRGSETERMEIMRSCSSSSSSSSSKEVDGMLAMSR